MIFMQLFAQMLPLIIFIAVDAIYKNIRVSIIAACGCAAAQLLFFYLKTGEFDWFVLLDVGLIVLLGGISVVLKNELFFKIKPAVIDGITIIFFVTMVRSSDQFLLDYLNRMMPTGTMINPAAVAALKTSMLWACAYVALHGAAVLYTAYRSSRRIWAFIAGPGVIFLFIPAMAAILYRDYFFTQKKNAPKRHK